MNAKRNPQHVSNSYNGGTIGRDSPSALLEVLAEVASQTLHSEKKHINSMLTLQFKPKTASIKRKESCFTVPQLVSMPVSHLVKQFAVFTSDELKRQYSYACALVPGCHQTYTSFASEEKARSCIKNHLEEHLEHLKADKETYDTFTAKSINHKNFKINLQSKKSRMQQIKKPQEMLNKENKDVILEKSTNYLRKILLNDINIKENEKQKCFQKSENKEAHDSELKNSEQIDIKVLGDHSYSERLDDKMPNRREMSLNNVPDDTTSEENIVLMVVGTDSIHMKEYSHIHQKLAENCQDPNIVYSPDKTQISTKSNAEVSTTTKPKGKAKFIGTSKEEREMALAYIERIKKKGNPTGNNLQCRICDPPRSFTAPTTLVSHYRSHAGIKPYECRICKAVFTRRHSLKYHMLIHQNQTRFTCKDCGKKFRHPSHFREHQRRHTGEAPFGCDDCGQRFKTRNTYKRHLKTRHNKILTTFGEVLHPPEEDIQKVRTNRKRKDCALEVTMSVDDITADAIEKIENHDETQVITNTIEQYVLKEDIDSNRNWDTNIIQIDKFESFEICSESQLNKTDGIETEIAVDCKYPDRENSNVNVECINSTGDGLLQLKNPFYDNLRVTNNEENHVVYQHIEDQDKIYEYKGETLNEIKEDIMEREVNADFSEEQDGSNLQVLQKSTHDYHKEICNSGTQERSITYINRQLRTEQTEATSSNKNDQKYDVHAITPNDVTTEKSAQSANNFGIENKEHLGNNIFCAQIIYANINILQTFSEVSEEVTPENQSNILQESECVTQSVATDVVEILNVSPKDSVEANQETDQRQSHQYLYVRSEQLSKLIAQNKYVTIPLHQIKLCRDHGLQAKVDNQRSIYIINEDIRTIIKQSEKQNTILVLSSDSFKNSIFQIDKNSIIVKALKR